MNNSLYTVHVQRRYIWSFVVHYYNINFSEMLSLIQQKNRKSSVHSMKLSYLPFFMLSDSF